MMMTMMWRSAAAAAAAGRYAAPSAGVDWKQLLTGVAPMSTVCRAANNTVAAPAVSCPIVPLHTFLGRGPTASTAQDAVE